MSRSFDIVAYSFCADILCPSCTVRGWGKRRKNGESIEQMLTRIADHVSINRMDETSFDSGEFPKVVFADQVNGESYDHCGRCYECIDHDPRDHQMGAV